jgi:hypothetical protein
MTHRGWWSSADPKVSPRNQAVDLFEQALGLPVKRRHVPHPALAAGATLLRRRKPDMASVMGRSLFADQRPSQADDALAEGAWRRADSGQRLHPPGRQLRLSWR